MKYVAILGIVLLFVYEFWAIKSKTKGDTISEFVWKASSRPLLPFGMGILMGHFFW